MHVGHVNKRVSFSPRSHLIVIAGTIIRSRTHLQYARENVYDDNSLEKKREESEREAEEEDDDKFLSFLSLSIFSIPSFAVWEIQYKYLGRSTDGEM